MMERPYRLSARFVATIEQPGRYGDGRGSGGLSLLVKRTTRGHLAKSWAQRISIDGRQRNLGLGSWPRALALQVHRRLLPPRRRSDNNSVAIGRRVTSNLPIGYFSRKVS